jgi:hypothetical protein
VEDLPISQDAPATVRKPAAPAPQEDDDDDEAEADDDDDAGSQTSEELGSSCKRSCDLVSPSKSRVLHAQPEFAKPAQIQGAARHRISEPREGSHTSDMHAQAKSSVHAREHQQADNSDSDTCASDDSITQCPSMLAAAEAASTVHVESTHAEEKAGSQRAKPVVGDCHLSQQLEATQVTPPSIP